jgi:predicted dithiol-disulfide oxidoreductase (DUF899 family)
MLEPGSDFICPGCSYYCDHICNLVHLRARRTAFAVVARAPSERVKARMGWSFSWYSCFGASFHEDFVTTEGQSFGLSVFLRRGGDIFQTYFTSGRGVEQPSNTFGLLDIAPWGRQETWEDSPRDGRRNPPIPGIRLHDLYDHDTP